MPLKLSLSLLATALLPAQEPDWLAFGPAHTFQIEYRTTDRAAIGIAEHIDVGWKHYPLPQSTFKIFPSLRSMPLQLPPLSANNYERFETIGPHKVEVNNLWFGNNFYDGEGLTGVGTFGYFDTEERRYHLYSPREVASSEISAILVEPDYVWLGLDHFVEDISNAPGGFARWDRSTHETKLYPFEFLIGSIQRQGDILRLSTNDGYACFTTMAMSKGLL